MILNRLYELAVRESLLDDPSFEIAPVPYVIEISENGDYLGIVERRGEVPVAGRKKSGPPKMKRDKGMQIPVPRAHGNTANKGFARYFVDTLPRVLPLNDEAKSAASRETFWNQVARAGQETGDPALNAALAFGRRVMTDAALRDTIVGRLDGYNVGPGDRCTVSWAPDEGVTIFERPKVRDWYRKLFAELGAEREGKSDQGFCQITGEYGPLARSHATQIKGVPGGLPAGVYVVSYDKAAFESYGLDGAVNAGVGFRAADGYTRALNALLDNKVPHCPKTCLKIGGVAFLFWTRKPIDEAPWVMLDSSSPEDVARLIDSYKRGQESYGADPNDFYFLCLSGNAARAIIRDYLEAPLPKARESLGAWFADLRIVDHFNGEAKADFPLWMLAKATVRSDDDLPPALLPTLARSALTGAPLPENVLAACLRRLRVETGAAQFTAQRMALIKLVLNRLSQTGDLRMTETLDEARRTDAAYICGRLFSCLAYIQAFERDPKKHGYGQEAPIVAAYYGAASAAPRSVFGGLLRQNQYRLNKFEEKYTPFVTNRNKEIEDLLTQLESASSEPDIFPAILSLPAQGRFAVGFYHQRAAYRAASTERRAAEEAAAT
jgi:CRISPR-associated protein Csd1